MKSNPLTTYRKYTIKKNSKDFTKDNILTVTSRGTKTTGQISIFDNIMIWDYKTNNGFAVMVFKKVK